MTRGASTIGGTPLVPVRVPLGTAARGTVRLWLKLESHNPFGSIKARTAEALLDALEADGTLRPGRRVVESTSGNLGIALAGLCAARGYACTLVVEPTTPDLSVAAMTAYGAEVVTVDETADGRTVDARLDAVRAIRRADPDAVWTNQYESPANSAVHAAHTAAELAKDAPDGRFDAVAVAVSTGGTLAGLARYFRDRAPGTRMIAVDAVGSAALGGAPAHRPHKLAGFGSGRSSALVAPHHWDHLARVRDEDAAAACLRIREGTGLSLGGSAGAAVLSAVMLALRDPALRDVACVCPDSGEKYARPAGDAGTAAGPAPRGVFDALDRLGRARPEGSTAS